MFSDAEQQDTQKKADHFYNEPTRPSSSCKPSWGKPAPTIQKRDHFTGTDSDDSLMNSTNAQKQSPIPKAKLPEIERQPLPQLEKPVMKSPLKQAGILREFNALVVESPPKRAEIQREVKKPVEQKLNDVGSTRNLSLKY